MMKQARNHANQAKYQFKAGCCPLSGFADVTDPAERERPLMEELRWTQSALAKAKDEIGRKQRALAEVGKTTIY